MAYRSIESCVSKVSLCVRRAHTVVRYIKTQKQANWPLMRVGAMFGRELRWTWSWQLAMTLRGWEGQKYLPPL